MTELGAWWRGGGRRWAWPVLAAVVVVAVAAYFLARALTASAGTSTGPGVTAAADVGPVTTQVATTGTVEPAQTRSLSFTVAGTVTGVLVAPGATVTPGQKLATVDTTSAQAAVDSAQSALDQAQTALTQAQSAATQAASAPTAAAAAGGARNTSCPTGSNVPAGFHPGPSATAHPSSSASPAPTPSPSHSPTASRSPAPSPSVRPSRPTSGSSPTTPGAGPSSCGGRGSGAGQGGSGRGTSSSAASSGTGASGRSGTSGGGSGGSGSGGSGGDPILSAQQRVNQATVTLQNAQDALDGTTITAPIAGKILAVNGKVGSQVGGGSAFITLADVYNMQINADFPEADADHVAIRQSAAISLANQPGTTFRATVVQVDPVGTSDGTMVRYGVVLSFVDPPADLLVGQSANAVVTTGSVASALRVPSTAVHGISGTTGTVRKVTGTTTAQVTVGVGLVGDTYTQITSGLVAGDKVIRSW